MEGPDGPPLLLFPVQLLQRISPWFPFFHIDEEFVLHTAQHGFKPSGIVNGRNTAPRCYEMLVKALNDAMMVVRSAPANTLMRPRQVTQTERNRFPFCERNTSDD